MNKFYPIGIQAFEAIRKALHSVSKTSYLESVYVHYYTLFIAEIFKKQIPVNLLTGILIHRNGQNHIHKHLKLTTTITRNHIRE